MLVIVHKTDGYTEFLPRDARSAKPGIAIRYVCPMTLTFDLLSVTVLGI